MSKLKISVLILLFISSASTLRAQFGLGKVEEIEAVQKRKLIVMIEEPRERMLERIEKKPKRGSVEDYKADLKVYNENIKLVVEKFWPYNKTGIQYKTFDEIKALSKTDTKEYAVIGCVSAEASNFSSGYHYSKGLYWVKDMKEDFADRDDNMFTVMLVNTIEDFMKAPVFYLPIFDVFPTKSSLVYGVKGIENYFRTRIETKKNNASMKDLQKKAYADMDQRAKQLPQKTLLIREEWLSEDLTEATLKNYYPYKYKVCDRKLMDEVVMSTDATYAYGVVLPYVISSSSRNILTYYHFVLDGADSQTVITDVPRGVAMMVKRSNFTPKLMTRMVEKIKGKDTD